MKANLIKFIVRCPVKDWLAVGPLGFSVPFTYVLGDWKIVLRREYISNYEIQVVHDNPFPVVMWFGSVTDRDNEFYRIEEYFENLRKDLQNRHKGELEEFRKLIRGE
jgi:hypothetical protein